MARSLNPNSTGHAPPPTGPADPPRRGVLAGLAAVLIGGLVSLFPLGAGALVFLDPILKRKSKPGAGSGNKDEGRPFRRVATVDALPADGTPVQVPVIADLTDAWNREPNQPIGAIYLRKLQDGQVACFNAICPHAGCFVGYAADRKVFQCPCHTSTFELDGQRILPSPSPRNMDDLPVDTQKLQAGEVWVQFVNYYPGHEKREAKP
jgi:quinol---cytochrome c reductase iron-sulfur subunit, bacillus type